MMQINTILNSLEDETKNSFHEFFGSNSRVNNLNENEFKKMFDSWYCSEVYKSFVQASIVFEKVFPDKEPNKEYTKKIAGNILSYKGDCLEEIFKR